MEKPIKPCAICNGVCQVKTVYDPGKKYGVVCMSCGNESLIKANRPAAINAHNKIGYRVHKTLF
ncbi:MAG: hypothetical protein ACOH15_11030 [Acetobacterium sp.]